MPRTKAAHGKRAQRKSPEVLLDGKLRPDGTLDPESFTEAEAALALVRLGFQIRSHSTGKLATVEELEAVVAKEKANAKTK